MESFDNLMKAACSIKSEHLLQDKRKFENQLECFKIGLYCGAQFANVRRQSLKLKQAAFLNIRKLATKYLEKKDFEEASYLFCQSLCIFKYIVSIKPNWKKEGIVDEDLTYFEEEGITENERNLIKSLMIAGLNNIAFCDLKLGNFTECRATCDEILRRDIKNVKALFLCNKLP